MALLDRFRRRPEWEHEDPLVRAAAARALGAEQRDVLAGLAEGDPDPRVRRAALKRLADPERLQRAAREDMADEVREEARELLLTLARDSEDAAFGEATLALLSEPRQLISLAREARLAPLRAAALARLAEPKGLAAVAKGGAHADTRLAALERLTDAALLADVAQKAEHKDVALAALERVGDEVEALEAVAARGRNKAAARRARARLEALAPAPAAPAAVEPQEPAAPVSEAVPPEPAADTRAEPLAETSGEAGVETVVEPVGEGSAAPEADEPAEAPSPSAPVAAAPAPADPAALEALVAQAEQAAAAEAEPAARLAEELRRSWRSAGAAPADPTLKARFDAALTRVETRVASAREAHAREQQSNLERLETLAARLEALAQQTAALELRAAEEALRAAREALHDPGPLPPRADRRGLLERIKAGRSALFPKAQELREADEWTRWANVAVQERLCEQVEALIEEPDAEKAARALKAIDEEWHRSRKVPREEGEPLWQRFRAGRERLRERLDAFFAERAQGWAENLRRKEALCEQAEALAGSSDWVHTAQALQRLQAEWKSIGPVARRDSEKVWQRFRKACDGFFSRRKADLAERKQEWAEHLKRKQALVERAEELSASTDWDVAAEEIKRLQAEWKTIGAVKRAQSEAIWQRFRAACDAFFERYKHRDEEAQRAAHAEQEALVAELEALVPDAAGAEAPPDLAAQVIERLGRFRRDHAVTHGRGEGSLQQRLFAARDRLIESFPAAFAGTELDPAASRGRMEKLVARVEGLAEEVGGAEESAEDLAARLRAALAANVFGGGAAADARARRAAEELEAARAAWKRLSPVPGDEGRRLRERFEAACRRVGEHRPRPVHR